MGRERPCTYGSQGTTVKGGVKHLRDVRGGVFQVDLDLAKLLVPKSLRLRHDGFEGGAADFALRIRAGLVGGDERDADAEVDLFWAACVREQCARLVDTPDEVPREI